MTYTESSYTVIFYVGKVRSGAITRDEVPNVYNLREVVFRVLDAEQEA